MLYFSLVTLILICCQSCQEPKPPFSNLQPVLSLPNEFKWQFQEGIDFLIYRAAKDTTGIPLIGIFIGCNPRSFAPEKSLQYKGIINGKKIEWKLVPKDNFIEQETTFDYQYSQNYSSTKIHIWIAARNESEINKLKEMLKELTFTKRNKST